MLTHRVVQHIARKGGSSSKTSPSRYYSTNGGRIFSRTPPAAARKAPPQKPESGLPSSSNVFKVYHNALELPVRDGSPSIFHMVWLRDCCECPKCRSSSGQKLFRIEDFRPPVAQAGVPSLTHDGKLQMKWYDGHISVYSSEFLSKFAYNEKALWDDREKANTLTWDHTTLAQQGGIKYFDYNSIIKNESTLHSWLRELDQTGLTLIRNAPLQKGVVTELCNLVSYSRMTMYGPSWDVESIPNPNNVAYTSLPLPLHADLCYYESPPGVQLLHCIKFDQPTGGENIFVDAFRVAEDLLEADPAAWGVLNAVPTTFEKYDKDHHLQFAHPIIERETFSEEVKAINWSPPFEGTQRIPATIVEEYYAARRKFSDMLNNPKYAFSHRLSPGEVVVFNNRRILHSRTAFDEKAGHRLLEGAYIGSDEFSDRLRVLNRKYAPLDPIHRGTGYTL